MAAFVAVMTGRGPTSMISTADANTVSLPGPGRCKLRRSFESAPIFGPSAKQVSSSVTRARITVASSLVLDLTEESAPVSPRLSFLQPRKTEVLMHQSARNRTLSLFLLDGASVLAGARV